jgi:hypothetical protein
MTIHVTPIPKLTPFADPSFTLGTSNAAGDAGSTVRSNATILTYDTTDPAAVAGAAAVGSATTAARRDHVHAGGTALTSGSAKVWLYINSDGTLRAGNYGVSSVTDNGTGNRTVNFSTSFDTADEYVVAHCLNNSLGYIQISSYSTSNQILLTKNSSGTNTDIISQHVYFGAQ